MQKASDLQYRHLVNADTLADTLVLHSRHLMFSEDPTFFLCALNFSFVCTLNNQAVLSLS